MILRRLLLFGSIFLFGLLVWAPPSLLNHVLERTSSGRLMMANTHGSLWQGRGILLLRETSVSHSLGDYSWRLRPWLGNIEFQTGDHPATQLDIRPFPARINIYNLHLNLPASLLEIAVPQLHPYRLQGMLHVYANQLQLSYAGQMQGQITADWHAAASGLSTITPLGDYRISLHGDNDGLQARLETLSGKLRLQATGGFNPGRGMQINGTAQAAPGSEGELNELLHYIGPETRPGIYTLSLMPQSAVLP